MKKLEEAKALTGKGKKFGLLTISNLHHVFTENREFAFDEEVKLHISAAGNTITDHIEDSVWRDWVGLEWDRLKGANAMFEIIKETSQPEIQDHESQELRDKAFTLWFALKLIAPIHTDHAYITSGYYKENKIAIQHYEKMLQWILPPQKEFQVPVDENIVSRWVEIYKKIMSLRHQVKEGLYLRIFRGLRTFEKGCVELYLEYRIPFFVKSIEALILPEKGDTTKKFGSRASLWWPSDWNQKAFPANSHEILGEIYSMRCDFDHLHGLKDEYSEKQYLRGYQCEQLARKAYQTILLNNEKLKHFTTDHDIGAYWSRIEGATPEPIFVSRPNPEKNFGGGKLYKDVLAMSFEEAVQAFAGRIKSWFLNPASPLVKENEKSIPNGFQVTQACCIVIDLLSQYINDLPASQAKEYIDFLKMLDPLFAEPISPPIESWSYKRNFKNGNIQTPKPERIETLAQGFYHAFRCGIVHSAKIMDYGRISGNDIAPNVIQLRSWGTTDNGREIAVNPTLLFGLVAQKFDSYVADLLDTRNIDLRVKFANKFYRDFGIKLSPEA